MKLAVAPIITFGFSYGLGRQESQKSPKEKTQYHFGSGLMCFFLNGGGDSPLKDRSAYAVRALTRADRREILRDTVFLCKTPRETPRCISGCAWRSASRALSTSPAAIAVSTFFTNVRIRPIRAPLIIARLALRIIRFLEDLWFAMGVRVPVLR